MTAEQRSRVAAQAVERWPDVPELYLYLGNAQHELGDDAQPAWRAGLEVERDVPATRSRLLLALGRAEQVLEVEGANTMAVAGARVQMALGG